MNGHNCLRTYNQFYIPVLEIRNLGLFPGFIGHFFFNILKIYKIYGNFPSFEVISPFLQFHAAKKGTNYPSTYICECKGVRVVNGISF